jgi:hypothetical protein
MRMFLAAAVLSCACLFAQTPTDIFEKAPPDVDQALRARVDIFFKAHVEGRFRQAEVAEDSKDAFYNAEKRRYIGYEVVKIQYSENFTKAVVITTIEMDWYTARLGKIRVKPPMKSLWRVDNGQWYWYVVPQKDWETPFGKMAPGPDPAAGAKPKWTVPDAATVLDQVQVSKKEINLASHEKSEDFAEIANNMPGEISIRIDQASPITGLQVSVDRETLKSGEKAKVIFKYAPANRTPKPPLDTTVTINPTGSVISFHITFAVAPELEKLIPKTQ